MTVLPIRPQLLDAPTERPVPFDQHAEEAVIGALVMDRDAIILIDGFLRPTHFYFERNGAIYAAIQALYQRREPPDAVTLTAELAARGTRDYLGHLAHCMNVTPTAVHIV